MADEVNPILYRLDREFSRGDVIAGLAAMPGELRALVESVARGRLTRRRTPEAWSAFETLCHFRDAAFVYSLRFRLMIFDDNPLLSNYDENNWVAATTDTEDDLPAILGQIAASRADLVRVLARAPEGSWQRRGRHEAIGTVVLEPYVCHQLAHEEIHLAQIRAALSA